MNLTIDIGNTNIKLGFFEGLKLSSTEKFRTNESIDWQSILSSKEVSHAMISRVAHTDFGVEDLCSTIQCTEVHHQLQLPFTSMYRPFTNLGIDRVVGLAAATHLFPNKKVLIIDAGTCITYDLITAEAVHVGGIISPGLRMRYQAMNRDTHQLPHLDIEHPSIFPPTNTHQAMHHGVVSGVIAEMETFVQKFEASTPKFMTILTGGDAGFLSKRVKNGILADENFLAFGLNLLLEMNKA